MQGTGRGGVRTLPGGGGGGICGRIGHCAGVGLDVGGDGVGTETSNCENSTWKSLLAGWALVS